jgi:hypothetical protein
MSRLGVDGIAARAGISLVIGTVCVVAACGRVAAKADTDAAHRLPAPGSAPAVSVGANSMPRQNARIPRGDVEVYPSTQLSKLGDALAQAGSTGRTFGDDSSFHYVESRRNRSGSPEIHDDWIDLTIVQSGHATLLTGGHVDGGALTGAGEHRGGTIVGGASRLVAPGDFFVVPAGVPHQFQVMPGDSIRYLTIKVAR